MPKYLIERDMPGLGKLTSAQLGEASRTSCNVLQKMSPRVQWIQSYVTNDKLYCVYIATNEEAVREHARQGGFPVNTINEIKTIIDPVTGGA
jgi:rRNA-processing protein FCF1